MADCRAGSKSHMMSLKHSVLLESEEMVKNNSTTKRQRGQSKGSLIVKSCNPILRNVALDDSQKYDLIS